MSYVLCPMNRLDLFTVSLSGLLWPLPTGVPECLSPAQRPYAQSPAPPGDPTAPPQPHQSRRGLFPAACQ
jgi:hypothetical protein